MNIAEILKGKDGIKLWSDTFGELILDEVSDIEYPINLIAKNGNSVDLTEEGLFFNDVKGVQPCIFPSKEMRDWDKFAWKKGDVLKGTEYGNMLIFKGWNNNDYTLFNACFHCVDDAIFNDKGEICKTDSYTKATDREAKEYIKRIEHYYGGKLNLETLQIEQPKQEFKDGDILFDGDGHRCIRDSIFIAKYNENGWLSSECALIEDEGLCLGCRANRLYAHIRKATDSEKQQLLSSLAKIGKKWNSDTKQIEDLPKKCEFKPLDWCLMRDHREKWKLCQFGFFDKGDEYEASYNAVGGNWYNECIPYNDSTKHLLGTTDEWEGGEG